MSDTEIEIKPTRDGKKTGIIITVIVFLLIASVITGVLIWYYRKKSVSPVGPSPAPPTPPASCPIYSQAQGDITGTAFDIMDTTVTPNINIGLSKKINTLTDCQSTCDSTPGCQWINWDQGSSQCWLRKATATPNINHGLRVQDNPQGITCPAYSTYVNYDWPGVDDLKDTSGNLLSKSTGTEAACQTYCTSLNTQTPTPYPCAAYSFDGSNCYPKYINTGPYANPSYPNMITQFKVVQNQT